MESVVDIVRPTISENENGGLGKRYIRERFKQGEKGGEAHYCCGGGRVCDLQLFKPMSLCFLDGPEDGIGTDFGKNPKKCPEYLGLLGLNLTKLLLLEP
ncbi:hypothetical protein Nepgr_008521 [Nepenthes gracilis]|uniref:Uncharacterized protein n=1 Tax=Nepenthes gracilis TaxID=150966 RepID=A0AAD3S9X2_NEPGR|nr:hypothetical protein Nepgr_008521 [Nepenthes gracilis]